ncbi:MAG TPA: hypothetical protein VLQ90_09870, partial [Pyrinomonadaceae bacterium]|nr:hypothetical protein [Pyrinomonadaceae bacterium]
VRANLTLSGSEYAMCGAAPDIQILVIDKTGATSGESWQEQLKDVSWGSAETFEMAWEALRHLVEPSPTPDHDPEESNQTESALALPAYYFDRSSRPV